MTLVHALFKLLLLCSSTFAMSMYFNPIRKDCGSRIVKSGQHYLPPDCRLRIRPRKGMTLFTRIAFPSNAPIACEDLPNYVSITNPQGELKMECFDDGNSVLIETMEELDVYVLAKPIQMKVEFLRTHLGCGDKISWELEGRMITFRRDLPAGEFCAVILPGASKLYTLDRPESCDNKIQFIQGLNSQDLRIVSKEVCVGQSSMKYRVECRYGGVKFADDSKPDAVVHFGFMKMESNEKTFDQCINKLADSFLEYDY